MVRSLRSMSVDPTSITGLPGVFDGRPPRRKKRAQSARIDEADSRDV